MYDGEAPLSRLSICRSAGWPPSCNYSSACYFYCRQQVYQLDDGIMRRRRKTGRRSALGTSAAAAAAWEPADRPTEGLQRASVTVAAAGLVARPLPCKLLADQCRRIAVPVTGRRSSKARQSKALFRPAPVCFLRECFGLVGRMTHRILVRFRAADKSRCSNEKFSVRRWIYCSTVLWFFTAENRLSITADSVLHRYCQNIEKRIPGLSQLDLSA